MKSRVPVLHAVGDPFVKAESIDAFRNEKKAANVAYRFVDYPESGTGSNPDATANGRRFEMPISCNAEADRKAREDMIAFFSEIFGKR